MSISRNQVWEYFTLVPAKLLRSGFAPVKWMAGKIVSNMSYSVSSGTLNPTQLN